MLWPSRVKKRRTVPAWDSSPSRIQPKLPDGLSNHDCTSLTMVGELQEYGIGTMPTIVVALAVSAKSPPGLFQGVVSKKLCVKVAVVPSAGVGYPWLLAAPTLPVPVVPSPQSESSRRSWIGVIK